MKKNKLVFIFIILLLLIAVILVITNSSSTLRRDISDFAIEDTASVTKIYMVDKSDREVTMEKTAPGEWMLNGEYAASEDKIKSLLKTMMDLRVMRPVSKSEHNNVVRRLAAKSVKVEIYQIKPWINIFDWIKLFPRETNTKTYYVGGSTKDNLGTFMLMENSTQPYVTYVPMLRGYISPRYTTVEDDWRDHQVFEHRLEEIKSIDMDFVQEEGESYRVENIDNLNMRLIDKESGEVLNRYDTLKLLTFVTSFEDIRYESLLSNTLDQEFIDSVRNTTPLHRITIIDQNNDTTEVITYRKKGFKYIYDEMTEGPVLEPFDIDRLYATLNEGRDFVLLQYFVFDKVLRPLSYFTEKR
ncbi:MAG: DUF4340 domain-containing protein [Bacteroidales bacterium]|nr:DUF4340 domain-containing protein [Bacteroidales bacterium]MCF8388443.1 DUF4340 domain-containing protein [Bacteroidales bacterium]MCF8398256.1 DUF4340 domain-containing protein [Bacteroidales bacterium]